MSKCHMLLKICSEWKTGHVCRGGIENRQKQKQPKKKTQ